MAITTVDCAGMQAETDRPHAASVTPLSDVYLQSPLRQDALAFRP